jgi:hypothetical protein
MVGGLVMSQVLTLFTTPVVYIYMERLARLGAWLLGRSQSSSAMPAE